MDTQTQADGQMPISAQTRRQADGKLFRKEKQTEQKKVAQTATTGRGNQWDGSKIWASKLVSPFVPFFSSTRHPFLATLSIVAHRPPSLFAHAFATAIPVWLFPPPYITRTHKHTPHHLPRSPSLSLSLHLSSTCGSMRMCLCNIPSSHDPLARLSLLSFSFSQAFSASLFLHHVQSH